MQDQSSETLGYSELAQRVAQLEEDLRGMHRRLRMRRIAATITVGGGLACLALWAQQASGPMTVRAPFEVVGANGMTILSVTESGPGAGKLEMKSTNGKAFTAGMTPEGVPFGRWDATNGTVNIGAPLGKLYGIRISPAGSDNSAVSLLATSTAASVMVGRNGVPKLAMVDADTSLSMGVLDSAGRNFLARFTSKGASGGSLEVANGSGQIVALVESNPTNSEGHAVFTNAGGQPLVKLGAAGDHGDVLLGGPNKAVAVWEMALTGMMH